MADTEWPNPVARIHDFTLGSWLTDYDKVDEEFDQVIAQLNAILTSAQAQELGITEVADDLETHIADNSLHAAGIAHMTGHWMQMDSGAINHGIKFTCKSLTTNGNTRLLDVNITGLLTDSGAGGLDTGAVAADSWYFAFTIYDPTLKSTDMLFSLNKTAPTLPAGYSEYRYFGKLMTDADTNIRPFHHAAGTNRWVLWDNAATVTSGKTAAYQVDLNLVSGTFHPIDFTLARPAAPCYSPTCLPADMNCPTFTCWMDASGGDAWIRVKPINHPVTTPEAWGNLIATHLGTDHSATITKGLLLPLDDNQQVHIRTNHAASFDAGLALDGWYDNLDAA